MMAVKRMCIERFHRPPSMGSDAVSPGHKAPLAKEEKRIHWILLIIEFF